MLRRDGLEKEGRSDGRRREMRILGEERKVGPSEVL